MNLANRLQIHYGWTPHYRLVSKKPVPLEPDFQVPQTKGQSGWIILAYEADLPVCVWMTPYETKYLKVCLDERLFGDTILRAELADGNYIISDVFVYNSSCVFAITTFRQRYDWLKQILERFQKHGATKMFHKSSIPKVQIKGYEFYDSKVGSNGCFSDLDDSQTIQATDIPDVYTVKGQEGYVLVPTLKLSLLLRSKGSEFKMRCIQKQGNWEIIAE